MKPRTAELVRMNGYKFNLLFGFVSLVFMPMISKMDLRASGIGVGILGFIMYVAEAWALWYKVSITRVRIVYERTGGSVTRKIPPLPSISWFVGYGFFIRMCFRILMLVVALSGFGLMDPESSEELNGFAITIMIIGVLFELFILGMSWFENRISKDDEEEDPQKEETAWRKSKFKMLSDPNVGMKEAASDFILFVAAMMFTHMFWTMSNNEMIGSIDRSVANGDSASGVFLLIFLCNLVLCMFMMVPMRLAYWIGESISVIDDKQKWKLRLSFLFAGISLTLPVFAHWLKVYVL